MKSGRLARGYAEYVRAADLMPDDPKVQVQAGTLLPDQGPVRGREDARTDGARQGSQERASGAAARQLPWPGLKDFEGAVKELEEAAQLDPDGSATYTSLGMVHLQQGSKPEAEAAFRRAVEIAAERRAAPHLALAQYSLGTGARRRRRPSF